MSNCEIITSSNNRAISVDGKINSSLSIIDEIYSHIIPSHKLPKARKRQVVYSFTDDITVACNFLKKHPKIYEKIGYIDVDIADDYSAQINTNKTILLVKPVFRVLDWIDMATYDLIQNKIKKDETDTIKVNNMNYTVAPIRLANTLIPSRWGVLSLASSSREYAVICQNLTLTILSKEEIENEPYPNEFKNYDLALCDASLSETKEYYKAVINYLNNDVNKLRITESRKAYIVNQLSDCEKL